MKVARGPRITLSITHRRAKAQAVSPDSRFKMLSNRERQQRRGGGGVLTWETGDTWVSAEPLLAPPSANSASPDPPGTGKGNGGGSRGSLGILR